MEQPLEWAMLDKIVAELIKGQNKALFALGRRLVPTLTSEDLLQPNDYPELENHPEFRYEEGVLAGMQTLEAAFRAKRREILSIDRAGE